MTVYNFGSINIDQVYRVPHLVGPGETLASESLETVLGGKGANQSVALARAGVDVKHIGKVGSADKWVVDLLSEYGVDTSGIGLVDAPSGHAIIQVDNSGENAIVLHGGTNQSFDASTLDAALSNGQSGDWLLLQNECNALADAFSIAKNRKMHVAFNPAPMTDAVKHLPLDQCRLLILNEVEARHLSGEDDVQSVLSALQQRYPNVMLVVTLGAAGATLLHSGEWISKKVPTVNVVDTTGAGDTFVGYLLAGMLGNHSVENALQQACDAGAIAVTRVGATPSIPTLDQVERLRLG